MTVASTTTIVPTRIGNRLACAITGALSARQFLSSSESQKADIRGFVGISKIWGHQSGNGSP